LQWKKCEAAFFLFRDHLRIRVEKELVIYSTNPELLDLASFRKLLAHLKISTIPS